jgi:signal transduction histidine kinase
VSSSWGIHFLWRRPVTLTLRLRIAFLSGALLMVLSAGLVLFINIVANVTVPSTEATGVPLPEPAAPVAHDQLPQTYITPVSVNTRGPGPIGVSDTITLRQAVLAQLQAISIIGLALVAVAGSLGAYWIAGRVLRPLNKVTRAARGISTRTLDTRVKISAPEQEIRELAGAFDSMLDRLQISFDQQSQFISNAAHELRTPLTTLRTNLEVTYGYSGTTLDDIHDLAPVLDRNVTRLERLVEDLLLMATGEDSLRKEEVSLASLIGEVLVDLTPIACQHQVQLRLTDNHNAVVYAEGTLLAQVFCNLLENSIRYNHPGGQVEVTISSDVKWAKVQVSDTGMGISPDEQARIFDRFYRVDHSRSRHKGGAGLGLSIVSHIVQIHGGQILVESAVGAGSKFTVLLPLQPSIEQPEQLPSAH